MHVPFGTIRRTRLRSTLLVGMVLAVLAIPMVGSAVMATPTCDGRPATIVGTPGDDRLVGTDGPDVILGRAGDDELRGKTGKDRLCGGSGDDALVGSPGNDRLVGGPGDDVLSGGSGANVLRGEDGADRVDGGGGDDVVDGGADRDLCQDSNGTKFKGCESADFSVQIRGPLQVTDEPTPFAVIVFNDGPDDAAYEFGFQVGPDSIRRGEPPPLASLSCDVLDEPESGLQPVLVAGGQRIHEFTLDCRAEPEGSRGLPVRAGADPDVDDPDDFDNGTAIEITWVDPTASDAATIPAASTADPLSSPAP
jgi:hypothetical protein